MAFVCRDNDTDFVNKVKSDLSIFIRDASLNSVLVFPPVNSFCRFLIHQLAQDSFDQLRTFSIGEDPERRIVVCTKELVARIDGKKDEIIAQVKATKETRSGETTMVVNNDEKLSYTQIKRTKSALPTIGIYRPPAARRSKEESCKSLPTPPSDAVADAPKKIVSTTRPQARVRRPDKQVYVPRAKRLTEEAEKPEDVSLPARVNEPGRPLSTLIIAERKSSKRRSSSPNSTLTCLPLRASQLVETKKNLCHPTSFSDLDWEGDENNVEVESGSDNSTSAMSLQPANLPPIAENMIEKKKKLCLLNSLNEENECDVHNFEGVSNQLQVTNSFICCETPAGSEKKENDSAEIYNTPEKCDHESTSVIFKEVTNSGSSVAVVKCDTMNRENCVGDSEQCNSSVRTSKFCNSISNSSNAGSPSTNVHCDKVVDFSDDDFHDALSKRKSDSFIDMSDGSSGSRESLSSGDSVNSPVSPVQLIKPIKCDIAKKASPSKSARIFNPDECDWDALLDEDGEVLDPFLMKELTSAVGEVHITQPQSDYRNYKSQVPADHHVARRSYGDEDFGHVVEIHSFPKEFKTNDLVAVFSPFKNTAGGFEIKWVDDTHALGVFASTLVAEQVLEYHHPMVRTRPLCDATLESRLKARRLSESIQSFRPRPETCAALARRLVTGALGVKLATARQEREEEKRVLREAREKRRLAAKQRDDIWNSG